MGGLPSRFVLAFSSLALVACGGSITTADGMMSLWFDERRHGEVVLSLGSTEDATP